MLFSLKVNFLLLILLTCHYLLIIHQFYLLYIFLISFLCPLLKVICLVILFYLRLLVQRILVYFLLHSFSFDSFSCVFLFKVFSWKCLYVYWSFYSNCFRKCFSSVFTIYSSCSIFWLLIICELGTSLEVIFPLVFTNIHPYAYLC